MDWILKMPHKIWIFLMFRSVIFPCSSAQRCEEFTMSIEEGPEEILKIIKQPRAEDEKKEDIANKEWTVFQRRVTGDVDFYRGWDEYKKGFGNRGGDFWLGLEELHERTKDGNMDLEIDMITKDTGTHRVARYSNFRIGPSSDNYKLHVSEYSGNATGNFLFLNNQRQFSTKDADHDGLLGGNCAINCEGGWWYSICGFSNLNGNFNKPSIKGIWWGSTALRYSEMKFRKRS